MSSDLSEYAGTNVIRYLLGQDAPKGHGYLSVSLHGFVKDAGSYELLMMRDHAHASVLALLRSG